MKKFIYIFLVVIIAISCGNDNNDSNGASANTVQQATEEVAANLPQDSSSTAEPQTFSQRIKASNSNNKTNTSPFLYLLVFLSIVLSLFSICLAFWLVAKERKYNDMRMNNRKRQIADLEVHLNTLQKEMAQIRSQQTHNSLSRSYQPPVSTTPKTQTYSPPVSQPQQPPANSTHTTFNKNKGNKKDKRQPAQPISKKVLYLGANSQECFFDFSEDKSDTSRFIAHIIPGDMAAEFEIIDVERIRSLNTSHSIRLAGTVAIKDAQEIKEQKPGKIHKTSDPSSGETYWIIDEPVTVEFKK